MPEIWTHLAWIFDCWKVLNFTRDAGLSASTVSLKEIREYCELFYIEDIEERQFLVRCILEMDKTFFTIQEELKALNSK